MSKSSVKKEYFELTINKDYYIINKEDNCIIYLGKLLSLEETIIMERMCWHGGPIYTQSYNLKFEYLKDQKLYNYFSFLNTLTRDDFANQYDSFYEIV